MNLNDYDFNLPKRLVAQSPAPERTAARLMRVDGKGISHHKILDIPSLLSAGDLLVLNDTKVRKARLRGVKETGGVVEILVERILPGGREAIALANANRNLSPGTAVTVGDARLELVERNGKLHRIRIAAGSDFEQIMDAHGEVPLPPYISRTPDRNDERRYQTVYANESGSCAAPTAGLHFTRQLLDELRMGGIDIATLTLHVGFGTFLPVSGDATELHPEPYSVPKDLAERIKSARERGGRVVACGTTALRALETCALRNGKTSGETTLYIRPGFSFRWTDLLLTNFHLPRTSLFVLACAFGERERVLDAYREAIAQDYRFYSYGDAMLLSPA